MLAQLFWIAVSVLESDYEYEFILAMRLLDKVLARLPLDRPDCRDKVRERERGIVMRMLTTVYSFPTTYHCLYVLHHKAPTLSVFPCRWRSYSSSSSGVTSPASMLCS